MPVEDDIPNKNLPLLRAQPLYTHFNVRSTPGSGKSQEIMAEPGVEGWVIPELYYLGL